MARDANQIVELEREILRAMCGGTVAAAQIDAVRESLRHYAWRDEEHRIVFEALARMRSADAGALREQLPAHATRMGFPDVDWPRYFNASAPQNFDLQQSLQKLRQLAAQE